MYTYLINANFHQYFIVIFSFIFRLGISYKDNQFGATTRILDRTKNNKPNFTSLAKSAKIISDGLQAGGKVSAPEREKQLQFVQDQYRKEKDKYIDRPLPPVKRRFNFGPGRAHMASKWKSLLDRYDYQKENRITSAVFEFKLVNVCFERNAFLFIEIIFKKQDVKLSPRLGIGIKYYKIEKYDNQRLHLTNQSRI